MVGQRGTSWRIWDEIGWHVWYGTWIHGGTYMATVELTWQPWNLHENNGNWHGNDGNYLTAMEDYIGNLMIWKFHGNLKIWFPCFTFTAGDLAWEYQINSHWWMWQSYFVQLKNFQKLRALFYALIEWKIFVSLILETQCIEFIIGQCKAWKSKMLHLLTLSNVKHRMYFV